MRRTVWLLILCLALLLTSCADREDGAASRSATSSPTETETTVTTTTSSTTATTSTTTETTANTTDAGTAVVFHENANVRVRFDEGTLVYPIRFDGYVVHNKAEYDVLQLEALEMYAPPHSQEYEALDLTPYTEDYFTDKALVVLYMSSGAGNVQMRVEKLIVQDGYFLTVAYTEETPTIITTEGSDWCLLLEVDAASVKDVTHVTGEKTKGILPD